MEKIQIKRQNKIKLLLFILIVYVFLIVLIKNLNISVLIKEFLLLAFSLLIVVYLFFMFIEVIKVQINTKELSNTLNKSSLKRKVLSYQDLFKERKFEEFEQKVLGLEILNKNSLEKRIYINAVLYYKLKNNNYLFEWVEPTTIYHKLSQDYFDVEYHNSNFSRYKINKYDSKLNRDNMSNPMKVYYLDLKILGDY